MTISVLTRDDLASALTASPLAVVSTTNAAGAPESALVRMTITPCGTLLFQSRASTRKVKNIVAQSQVAVVIGFDGQRSIQLEGEASFAPPAKADHLRRRYEMAFGADRVVAGAEFIRVRVNWARTTDMTALPPVISEGNTDWACTCGDHD